MRSERVVALALTVVAIGACSEAAPRATTAPTTPATLTPSPRAALTPRAVADHVVARLDLQGGPDYLGVSTDAVWVKLDNGSLVRLDPDTSRVVATTPVATGLCQGLGVSGDEIWACTDEGVARIDASSGRVVARVAVTKSDDQGILPIGHGHLWLVGKDGTTLVGVDSKTNRVAKEIPLGTRCGDAAVTRDAVWVACFGDGTAVRVDPVRAVVSMRVRGLGEARRISATPDAVWVGYGAGLAHLDATTGYVVGLVDAAPGATGSLFATADSVWVRSAAQFLRRVDVATHTVADALTAPERSGGTVVVGFGALWTTAYDDDVVYRLRP